MTVRVPQHVRDTQGNTYVLDRPIGRGGQGTVYQVVGARRAVKLLLHRSPASAEACETQIRIVGRHPLEGLPVARPLALLAPPHVGYVMELIDGMVPFVRLGPPSRGVAPSSHYQATGGLRRRLRLLAKVSDALAEMHTRGLVYADLSPNNVLASEAPEYEQVWLIDTDNVIASTAEARGPWTPFYAAPELHHGSGYVSSFTDAYALAVMAFETLALTHPLIGDAVLEGPPELEEAALGGKLPWVDDPDDRGNERSFGFRRDLVLTRELATLFQRMFGPGRHDRLQRPGAAAWRDAFRHAAQRTVRCHHCDSTYLFTPDVARCPWPWCGERRGGVLALLLAPPRLRTPPSDPDIQATDDQPRRRRSVEALTTAGQEDLPLTSRTLLGLTDDRVLVKVRWDGRELLRVDNRSDWPLRIGAPLGQPGRGTTIQPGAAREAQLQPHPMTLALDRPGELIREFSLRIYPGAGP